MHAVYRLACPCAGVPQITYSEYMRPTKEMLTEEAQWMIKHSPLSSKALGQEVRGELA